MHEELRGSVRNGQTNPRIKDVKVIIWYFTNRTRRTGHLRVRAQPESGRPLPCEPGWPERHRADLITCTWPSGLPGSRPQTRCRAMSAAGRRYGTARANP